MELNIQPIFIIGAARSGTKILRDIIAKHPSIDSVPFDINYIWRLGNEKVAHDELSQSMLSESNSKRIRSKIIGFQKKSIYLVEKTVSNCLRVEFINGVFPEAKFIHLVRDPLDVIESVHRQWNKKPDLKYLIKKGLNFPIFQCFDYALEYTFNEMKRISSKGTKTATWGPVYDGMYQDLVEKDLWEVCAIQWQRCYQLAEEGLNKLEEGNVMFVKYEDFVRNPESVLQNVSTFLNIENSYEDSSILNSITTRNIGKGEGIPEDKIISVLKIILPYMEELGYAVPSLKNKM